MAALTGTNGLGPKTIILKLEATNIGDDSTTILADAMRYLTAGDSDGTTKLALFTIAGVEVVSSGVVHVAVQGTGDVNSSDMEADTTVDTVTVLATFEAEH